MDYFSLSRPGDATFGAAVFVGSSSGNFVLLAAGEPSEELYFCSA